MGSTGNRNKGRPREALDCFVLYGQQMAKHVHRKEDPGQLCGTDEAGGSEDQSHINDYLLRSTDQKWTDLRGSGMGL